MPMKLFENLTKENVAYFAAVHYNNPQFTKREHFHRDLRKVSVIKKHMNQFDSLEENQDYVQLVRKITNNVIIFLNFFGVNPGIRILFTLMEQRFLAKLIPILELILAHKTPIIVEGVNNLNIIMEQIETDEFFASFVNQLTEYQGMKAYETE